VRPLLAVVPSPALDLHPGVGQAANQFAGRHSSRKRLWKLSTYAFSTGLPAWRNTSIDPMLIGPNIQRSGDELRPTVHEVSAAWPSMGEPLDFAGRVGHTRRS
jgi:hypothetical protein